MPTNIAYEGIAITDTTYAGEAAADFIVKAITDNAMVKWRAHLREGRH